MSWRTTALVLAAVAVGPGCFLPLDPSVRPPQTVVLFATPKFISDFANPEPDVERFLDHYAPLTTRASNTVVVFAVGNSDHILHYRGGLFWNDKAEWARITSGVPVSGRALDYHQIDRIVRAFKNRAEVLGIAIKVFDQIDSGIEFTLLNDFKLRRHPECGVNQWHSYDIRVPMKADTLRYASAPAGIVAGTLCGDFLVDQVGHYVRDLGFDGILYGNQLGTRGRWLPGNGPGYSDAEAAQIRDFLAYSQEVLGEKELMWFDSYNTVEIERATFSFPSDGYQYFDFMIASGFCAVTSTGRYIDNLKSKLRIPNRPRVLATLDYVDPWYDYKSMVDFADKSEWLEWVAIAQRRSVDGVVLFANDHEGVLVPRALIESFARRFFL